MATVWKFGQPASDLGDIIEFEMPSGARILSAANQREELVIYALVDPKAMKRRRQFRVAGTGHPIETPAGLGMKSETFVGTVLLLGGSFVVHVFDLGETND
jgi:hypothetical protein